MFLGGGQSQMSGQTGAAGQNQSWSNQSWNSQQQGGDQQQGHMKGVMRFVSYHQYSAFKAQRWFW